MQKDFGVHHWNIIKVDIQDMYPFLSDSDLLWRDGDTKTDLIKELAVRVGVTWKEFEKIIDNI